jgi:hypothetical protein
MKQLGPLEEVGAREGLLGKGALTAVTDKALHPTAIVFSGVEADAAVAEPVAGLEAMLGAIPPRAVGRMELVVRDLLDGLCGRRQHAGEESKSWANTALFVFGRLYVNDRGGIRISVRRIRWAERINTLRTTMGLFAVKPM